MRELFEELERKMGYRFKDRHLLHQALTHSSYANEQSLEPQPDATNVWSFWGCSAGDCDQRLSLPQISTTCPRGI